MSAGTPYVKTLAVLDHLPDPVGEEGDTSQVESGNDRRPFALILLGDYPDSRLLIELSSYGSDLAEARHALDLAIRGAQEGSALADAARHLVGLAVVAYCRTVMHSNVRGRLIDHIAVPDEFMDVHERVRSYRNATVAHSQSELAATYAIGVLDSDTLRVRDVASATVLVPFPDHAVREFKALIDVMERRLDEAIEPVRARLMTRLTEMGRDQLEAAPQPDIHEKWASEFTARTKRSQYPTGHTVYWDSDARGTGATPR